jgi:predicted secreted protein
MAISGKQGTVKYAGGNVVGINSFSLDLNNNNIEVTTFSTAVASWREFIAGLNGFSGSVSGFWSLSTAAGTSTGMKDLQDNILTPSTGTLVLEVDETGGGKYSGDVFLSRMSLSDDIDATADVSFDFTGNGALTYTTTT